jgi:transposase-like protein
VARGKKEPEVKKPAPKAKRPRKSTKKADSIVRTIIHPETGERISMAAYDQYPEEFKYMAKMMYISGMASVHQIALKLNIPENTIRTWQTRDSWVSIQREVRRLASKEAVKVARTSMSNYIKAMDRELNAMQATIQERLENLPADKQIDDEATLLKFKLEILKAKRDIIRMLTYGMQGKAFTPHPSNFVLDGTLEGGLRAPLTANSAEEILGSIPPFLKEAAHFVMDMELDENDLDEAVLDAVAAHIDQNKNSDDDEDDDNIVML